MIHRRTKRGDFATRVERVDQLPPAECEQHADQDDDHLMDKLAPAM
jgi:hypothetical protein